MNNVKGVIGDKISYAKTSMIALKDADALIIATEWNEFSTPNFLKMVTSTERIK